MTYNLTNLTAANNFLEYSIAVNDLAGGFLFAIFIVIISLVVYSRIEGSESQRMIAASFFGWVLSAVLNAVGILSGFYVLLFLILLLGVLIPTMISRFG